MKNLDDNEIRKEHSLTVIYFPFKKSTIKYSGAE